ncbi:hypothetical protein FQV37_2011 [Psychrobacter nivimaris]|uniref:Uncharacterized protein n=1 Tax=Psychrobacter nivimaris TaxID=281738 RepID=A0A6N7C3M3_9GAMM|nr:hypothetical protein FQV37_2011 [Psychrobacter nivimaris]
MQDVFVQKVLNEYLFINYLKSSKQSNKVTIKTSCHQFESFADLRI